MRLFALGLLTIWAGSVIGLARVVIPGNAILLACNVFMVGGMIVVVQGIRVFRGFSPWPPAAIGLLAAVVGSVFCYWLFVHNNLGMRIAIVSCTFSFLCASAAASMIRHASARDRLIYWPTGLAFAFSACYLGARSVAGFSGAYGADLFAPVPIETASTICANLAYVGCSFGMLLASNNQLRNEAEKMALYDPLTNLPNRRLLLDRLLAAEQDAVAKGQRVGVIYLDLDGFKLINDTLGHDAGDDLLRNVSASMSAVLRVGDCLARIGGDEFVVLAEGVENRKHLEILAARLKSAVEKERIPGSGHLTMRASCGIALFPEDGSSGRDVMREADAAMYHAKRRSRIRGQATAV
jgi:diguanylate cyclase (GGDEF)-like protein